MKIATPLVLALLVLAPVAATADLEADVRAAVFAAYALRGDDLVDAREGIAAEGAMQFWSSGGLMLVSKPDDPPIEYESFNVQPKHIEVIKLSDDAAAVLYYAEGSMQPKGRPVVSRYLTRVMEVYVLEDGAWKARAGHWSPLQGGGGTSIPTN
jgi:hypothetical protein